MVSHYLPNFIRFSNGPLDRFDPETWAKVLQPESGAMGFDLEHNLAIFAEGDIKSRAIEGLGPLILLYLIGQMEMDADEQILLKKWPTNAGRSIHGKPFKTGQAFRVNELIEELTHTQHPSATYQLADYYFGNIRRAMDAIRTFAGENELYPAAAINLTGRYRLKEQQSYRLEDLYKIGAQFYQNDKLVGALPVRLAGGRNYHGIVFGTLRKSAIFFHGKYLLWLPAANQRRKSTVTWKICDERRQSFNRV